MNSEPLDLIPLWCCFLLVMVIGLLAFMLAFTFSMAATRFDARRQGVLEEANAIGTTWLRARLLHVNQQPMINLYRTMQTEQQ